MKTAKSILLFLKTSALHMRALAVVGLVGSSLLFLTPTLWHKSLTVAIIFCAAWLSYSYSFSLFRWLKIASALCILAAVLHILGIPHLAVKIFTVSFFCMTVGVFFSKNTDNEDTDFRMKFMKDVKKVRTFRQVVLADQEHEEALLVLKHSIFISALIVVFGLLGKNWWFLWQNKYLHYLSLYQLNLFIAAVVFPGQIAILFLISKRWLFRIIVLMVLFMALFHQSIHIRSNLSNIPHITDIRGNFSSSWSEVTINGKDFQSAPFVGSVIMNGEPKRVLLWRDDKVVFELIPNEKTEGTVQLILHNGRRSNVEVLTREESD